MSYYTMHDNDFEEASIACKRCGEDGLHWERTPDGWRLFDDGGNQHGCPERGGLTRFDLGPHSALGKRAALENKR